MTDLAAACQARGCLLEAEAEVVLVSLGRPGAWAPKPGEPPVQIGALCWYHLANLRSAARQMGVGA